MNAQAPSAPAQEPLLASSWAIHRSGADLGLDDTSLAFAVRLRHGLLGVAIGVLAITVCTALGLLIASGPFHTSVGSLA